MNTNLNVNYPNTSFGMKFPTYKLIKAEAAPFAYLSDESAFFSKRLNITPKNSHESSDAAIKVREAFRQQFPELAEALARRYVKLANENYDSYKKINTDSEALAHEIDVVMAKFNLRSTIDIEV